MADASKEHYSLRVRYLPKLGSAFLRPFPFEFMIQLPLSIHMSEVHPNLVDCDDILPFVTVIPVQELGNPLHTLANLCIKHGMNTIIFSQLTLQIQMNDPSNSPLRYSKLPCDTILGE
jgi:hypothetical protein